MFPLGRASWIIVVMPVEQERRGEIQICGERCDGGVEELGISGFGWTNKGKIAGQFPE
ncbi:hypothetical protein CGMCC3_g12463 [Colletotrichum fructicola]|nr:uncharacterized protein CGMCC3_g12463 [Colletotrichum fructicola]KAE9571484.1 hypothetical protein CGMCC3_g12463 [Colletotrichum fructicola]